MAQRWRSFLSLTLILVSIGFLAISYSLHAHPSLWTDSFWSSWLNLFPARQAHQLGGAWAGGFFLMGALLLLGSTALLIWGRRWRKGLFLGVLLGLIVVALLAGAALTDRLSQQATASGFSPPHAPMLATGPETFRSPMERLNPFLSSFSFPKTNPDL